MKFNYNKLIGRIIEKYGTRDAFAKAMNLSYSTLNFKLNNKSDWSTSEIANACKLLDIELADSYRYFFNEEL